MRWFLLFALLVALAGPSLAAGPLEFEAVPGSVEGPPYPTEGVVTHMQLCRPAEACNPLDSLVVGLENAESFGPPIVPIPFEIIVADDGSGGYRESASMSASFVGPTPAVPDYPVSSRVALNVLTQDENITAWFLESWSPSRPGPARRPSTTSST